MSVREYSGNAIPTTLSVAMAPGDATMTVVSASNWPVGSVGPFFITINAGQSNEERVLGATRSGNVISGLTRGQDGTSAVAHSVGESAQHTFSATDAREANTHVNATLNVHGRTSGLVGVSDAQTISNKTFDSTNTFASSGSAATFDAGVPTGGGSTGGTAAASTTQPSHPAPGTSLIRKTGLVGYTLTSSGGSSSYVLVLTFASPFPNGVLYINYKTLYGGQNVSTDYIYNNSVSSFAILVGSNFSGTASVGIGYEAVGW